MVKKQHIPEPRLYKSLFEVRYAPKLDFFHLLYPAVQKLTGYPHWEVSQVAVTLRNFENLCSLSIQHNRFAYEQDTDQNKNERTYIEEALEKLPPALNISSCNRLGFRRKYLISTAMSFEELVLVMNLKLISQNTRLKEIMPSQTEALLYRVDFSDGNHRFHIHAGPTKKAEIPRFLEFNQENHLHPSSREEDYRAIINAYPEVSVFLDIDIYRAQENIPIGEALAFWEEAQKRLKTLSRDFCHYLFDIHMEG